MSEEPCEYEPVVPFVAVKSNGGTLDDTAYVAGFEIGALDALMSTARPAVHKATIHSVNADQLDLLAMYRGYTLVTDSNDGLMDGWSHVTLRRVTPTTELAAS